MLLIVCPNLAVDRILEVPNFRAAAVQRSTPAIVQPGGKGSNVARVFRQLGGEVALAGFAGRRNSHHITEPLRNLGIHVDVVEAFDESRTCTIILDLASNRHPTVINEESPLLESNAAERLLRIVDEWLPRVTAVLVDGSLSQGLDDDFYRYILERARSSGKFTALDAAGAALAEGIRARPDFLKINAQEFGDLVGVSQPNTQNMLEYLSDARDRLAHHTAITFGEAGAILSAGGGFWQAAPPEIFSANPIGAGDAFAAGYLYEFMKSGDMERSFRLALAAAASDASTVRPGHIIPDDVKSLAASIDVDQL